MLEVWWVSGKHRVRVYMGDSLFKLVFPNTLLFRIFFLLTFAK